MIACEDKKFIFAGVEKCAATSMHHTLGRFNTLTIQEKPHPFEHDPFKRRKVRWTNKDSVLGLHTPLRVIQYFVDDFLNYDRFCIFRNPWDIFVSRYFHYQRKRLRHRQEERMRLARKYSFCDWIKRIKPCLSWINDIKNLREFVSLEDGSIGVNRIYSFEHLPDMIEDLQNRYNIQLKLQHTNTTDHKPYYEYYEEDQEAIDIIRQTFDWGINLFGYRFGGRSWIERAELNPKGGPDE